MFTSEQLDHLSHLIAERTGLNTFDRGRNRLIEVLRRRPEAMHYPDAYFYRLQMLNESHPIWQALLAELTIGETYFLRDTPQIEALRQHVLPMLIREKRQNKTYRLRLWSAGCATGEEPYTLAMLLHELVPDTDRWDIQILGTDINEAALEVAREARYRDWSFRNTAVEVRERYFVPIYHRGPGNILEVRPELRRMVRFQYSNLVASFHEAQDLIICRNVLIYFTREQTEIAETRLTKTLAVGGWLMLSLVEVPRHTRHQFEIQRYGETTLFRKRSAAQVAEAEPTPDTGRRVTLEPNSVSVSLNSDQEASYRRAVRSFQRGQLEEAMTLTRPILDSDQAAVYSLMASILLGLGDKQGAYEHLMRSVALDTLYPDAHYLIALLHLADNDFVATRTALRAAVYCRPDFALAHLLSGDLFMKEGDMERATRAWATARRFANEFPSDLPLSDVADVTAGQLVALVDHRLGGA